MHWLSLSTSFTTLLAVFLAGFTEDVCVSAHSRPLSPFLKKNVVNGSASATTIASMIPRGGASRLSTSSLQRTGAVLSEDVEEGKKKKNMIAKKPTGWLRGGEKGGLIPEGKTGWVASLVFSFIYLGLLLNESFKPPCDYKSDGFCVTHFNPDTGMCKLHSNSHFWAFAIDMVFTGLAFVLGNATGAEKSEIISIAAVIVVHGFLHGFFDYKQCLIPSSPDQELTPILIFANAAYFGFTALVSYVALNMAMLPTSIVLIGTLAVAGLTVYLSQPTQGNGISPIFMTTQLLVSVLGLFDNKGQFSDLLGNMFALPCFVSLVELLSCCSSKDTPGFFNKIGGHVWYDFFLHSAVLSSFIKPKPKD